VPLVLYGQGQELLLLLFPVHVHGMGVVVLAEQNGQVDSTEDSQALCELVFNLLLVN